MTFLTFLEKCFNKTYTMPKEMYGEVFDKWLNNITVSEFIKYADRYGKIMLMEGEVRGLKRADELINKF